MNPPVSEGLIYESADWDKLFFLDPDFTDELFRSGIRLETVNRVMEGVPFGRILKNKRFLKAILFKIGTFGQSWSQLLSTLLQKMDRHLIAKLKIEGQPQVLRDFLARSASISYLEVIVGEQGGGELGWDPVLGASQLWNFQSLVQRPSFAHLGRHRWSFEC